MLEQILSSLEGITDLEREELIRTLLSKEDRVLKVKKLLGLSDENQNALIEFALAAVEERILSYINQNALPRPLENVLIIMCVSYYKTAGFGSSEVQTGPISSVRRGDVQTTFAVRAGASASADTFNLGASDDFFGWRNVLNEYRTLRW